MFEAREYQEECLEMLDVVCTKGRNAGLVVMAPGLGKTITAALHVRQWMETNKGRVLYLCHQTDIIDQSRTKFEAVLGKNYRYGSFHGKDRDIHKVDFLFGSFQTMEGNLRLFDPKEFDYVIIDESHHSHAPSYLRVVKHFKPKFLLGITATPDRHDGLDIREIYGEEIFSLPIEEALVRGLLAPVDYRLMSDEIQLASVMHTPAQRMSITELNRKIFVPKRDQEIAKTIAKYTKDLKNPRVMIFCESIKQCSSLSSFIAGSVPIHSRIPAKERVVKLDLFRQGGVNTILTVDAFNEGVDIPEANLIVFLRSTSSYTIFLQQLGRGLRKAQGKDKVLVLDFAANCERLEMVYSLWTEIDKKIESAGKPSSEGGTSSSHRSTMQVEIGNIRFSEVIRDVLKIIRNIRLGYTKGVLADQLQKLAKALGRTPTAQDVAEAPREKIASVSVFQNVFGSFNSALEAAGLGLNKAVRKSGKKYRKYSDDELISALQQLAEKLGRTPTAKEVAAAATEDGFPSATSIQSRFGTFNEALIAAGLPVGKIGSCTKEMIISDLQALGKELGRTPTYEDVAAASKQKKCVSTGSVEKFFDTFRSALLAAGFERKQSDFTDEELLEQLRAFSKKIGRVPRYEELEKASSADETPHPGTYANRFGSFAEALQKAGLISAPEPDLTNEDVLRQIRKLAMIVGRTPTIEDANEASLKGTCLSPSSIIKRFGSWSLAIAAAGFDMKVPRREYKDQASIIKQLKHLSETLRRVPTEDDVRQASSKDLCVPLGFIVQHFGSFEDAIRAASLSFSTEASVSSQAPDPSIERLRQLAARVGRIPLTMDIMQEKDGMNLMCSLISTFGSYQHALEAAGFSGAAVENSG